MGALNVAGRSGVACMQCKDNAQKGPLWRAGEFGECRRRGRDLELKDQAGFKYS